MPFLMVGIADNASEPAVVEDKEAPLAGEAQLIRVPLPITGEVDTRVKRMVDDWLSDTASRSDRPTLILEFRPRADSTSRGSQFERSLSLARYLSGESLSRIRTVAYISGDVQGHAVLPVLACEQIVAAPEAVLGSAGIDETQVDEAVRGGYREICAKRRTVPAAVALGMLDPSLAVYRVKTLDGVRYVLQDELESIKQSSASSAIDQIVAAGDMLELNGAELRLPYGFASHLASDRMQLADALRLPIGSIDEDPTLGQDRKPLLVEVYGQINSENISWIERSLRDRIERDGINLVCLVISSPGGSISDSVRLALYLAGLDASQVRTVAFVESQARSDAALIALACDQLAMADTAVLGGPGSRRITDRVLRDLRAPVREIATAKGRGWSIPLAMVDQQVSVSQYTRLGTGQVRYLCPEELEEYRRDGEEWEPGMEVNTQEGLTGAEAARLHLARFTVPDLAEFQRAYHIEESLERIQPTWAHRMIEFLASPTVAGGLLFIGWFALMIEFASPGLSVAGFASAVCFLLFFWANYLHGTAGWLEVLLFVAGVTCVFLEVFVIPGLGAFGIGGGLLIVVSIVLATQTYIVPRNSYELNQLPVSLTMVAAAGSGAVVSLFVMGRLMTQAPLFRRIALESPDNERMQEIAYQESLAHREYLMGKRGVTTTQLRPSGKARFGDDVVDVLSEGDIIPADTPVFVVKVQGNEVRVRGV